MSPKEFEVVEKMLDAAWARDERRLVILLLLLAATSGRDVVLPKHKDLHP